MGASKRGIVLTGLALAVALGGAVVGHGMLANRQNSAQDAPAETTESTPSDADALMLADYDATVYTELDEPVLLSAIADGKPLVMNFWATWCPYCVQEMPDFKDIYERFGDQVNFAFIDVTDGQRETRDKAAAWLADNGFDELPAYYDADLAASTAFGAYSLPTTVVVSADGQVLAVSPGVIDPELLSGALAGLV